jgi:hypothetical protein
MTGPQDVKADGDMDRFGEEAESEGERRWRGNDTTNQGMGRHQCEGRTSVHMNSKVQGLSRPRLTIPLALEGFTVYQSIAFAAGRIRSSKSRYDEATAWVPRRQAHSRS